MIYSVKRFSGDDEKKGMGLGTKLALGTAAVGGTLLAGRAGMLGSGIQKGIGTATAAVAMTTLAAVLAPVRNATTAFAPLTIMLPTFFKNPRNDI